MALDFELSDEHKMIQKSVRDLLKQFEPKREEMRKQVMVEKKFPQELWNAIADAGIIGSLIPEEYGGTGMGLLALAIAVEEMGKMGFGNALIVLTAMDSLCVLRNGSDEMKKRLLPDVAKGKIKFCFALTEPDAGSNTTRLKTLAKRNGNGNFVINGSKVFITGADVADQMLLICRSMSIEEVEAQKMPKFYGLSLFIVDTKSKGMTMKPIPTRGIEGMIQYMLYFDNMEVPAENLVGPEHGGSMCLFNSLNPERILAAASAVGLTEMFLKKAVEYSKERRVFKNTPIGAYQGLSHPLAQIKIEQEAAKLMMYKAAWAFDQQKNPGEVGTYANMAKFLAADLALKACDQAIETLGGYGFSEEYGLIYYWDVVRLLKTAPITREMILNYVSEHMLEMPRSY